MSTLLRDIFTIPETTSTADYVLRLTESVDDDHLSRTLDDYVATEELAVAFDRALAIVSDAIDTNTSRGSFLTGSFGSGKSHFMAVLYALLRQHPKARALPELGPVIARHDPQLQHRRVLPLTFHMLGAESMEQALFDGYLRQVRELHPDATIPTLHESARLLSDADALRSRIGDDQFFAGLNDDGESGDVWGAVLGGASRWDAHSYEAAKAAAAGDSRRNELVTALGEKYYQSYTRRASYVGLDEGLEAISAHAQSLGYDAVVLFLDELVLWLAFQIRNPEFFGSEAQKMTKLVEGGIGGRRIPLVSFIARQMDLRRWLVDSGASGDEQKTLEQAFRFQEGRFSKIQLGDDNLPYVAHKRLLTPKDAAAVAEIDRAFENLDRRSESWDVLLDGVNAEERYRGADAEQFRLTYPFSPALVSTLRSLAGVMQRERTALKVMQQLLVDGRDHLTIDHVIPVGDAFDYLVTGAAGDQPLDQTSAALFRSANELYRDKLRPQILKFHNLNEEDLDVGSDLSPALAADLRLAKTLLLSAVAPNVPALKGLTASRLASLNHGSIRSPLPGGEASVVLSKVRAWSAHVPEIKVESSGHNPLISVQLSDVDYELIVDKALGEDTPGRRRELIKQMVLEGFGLNDEAQQAELGVRTHRFVWRGSSREVDLMFGNVRDTASLSDDDFENRLGTWRFVIDYPFDDPGHSTAEDLARVDGFRARGWDRQTIVWLPRFFTEDRLRDVRRLVILNYLLDGSGERFVSYSDQLSEVGRTQARAILQSQRAALKHTLGRAIQVAYDVESPTVSGDVVGGADHPDVLASLTPRFTPRPPTGGTLKQAFDALVSDAYTTSYPGHPRFEPDDQEVRPRDLQVVAEYVERALASPDNRVSLGADAQTARRVANPLGVGRAAETHFVMGDEYFSAWGPEFERRLGARDEDANDPVTVGELRGWIDNMEPRKGLATDVSDLVILAWATLRRRAWFHYEAPIPVPRPGALRDSMQLRVQEMPDADTWERATSLAGALFGISVSQFMTPAAVANLAEQVRDAAVKYTDPAHKLVAALEMARDKLVMTSEPESGRLATARKTTELCDALRTLKELALIRRLAAAEFTEPAAAGRSLSTASGVAERLNRYEWHRLRSLLSASSEEGARADRAAAILAGLRDAVRDEEMHQPVAEALNRAQEDTFRWLEEAHREPGAAVPQPLTQEPEPVTTDLSGQLPPVGPRPGASGQRRIRSGESLADVTAELERFAIAHPDSDIIVEWRAE